MPQALTEVLQLVLKSFAGVWEEGWMSSSRRRPGAKIASVSPLSFWERVKSYLSFPWTTSSGFLCTILASVDSLLSLLCKENKHQYLNSLWQNSLVAQPHAVADFRIKTCQLHNSATPSTVQLPQWSNPKRGRHSLQLALPWAFPQEDMGVFSLWSLQWDFHPHILSLF